MTMNEQDFETIAAEEFSNVPARFTTRISNVALLVEDIPSDSTREEEKLTSQQTLLGLYRGVPLSLRGSGYGVGDTLPDTITLYREPIIMQAHEYLRTHRSCVLLEAIRISVRETLWHEIGHAFGLNEETVDMREVQGTNHYPDEETQKDE